MNSNDNHRMHADDVIVLGVASVETQGILQGNEPMGGEPVPGISEE
ncbi:benenodin family lasso peptide [Stenotrophomonas acidaminiphila]|nr:MULTISPECIES: benenodin family lasso peptide [Stenotrophomonas]MCH1908673.1 benenodin family lasso peptide [Stenotrophomonas sp. Y6]MPS34410.1 benenodin family lasso peptide [Stenotrophomonas sp.]MTI74118.1 benenodin family lasso peptide [Stenotrophomonas sp.]WPU55513.1 benenodin family lasso peptide [Stenotrophomonas acidaminiphila]